MSKEVKNVQAVEIFRESYSPQTLTGAVTEKKSYSPVALGQAVQQSTVPVSAGNQPAAPAPSTPTNNE